MRRRKATVGWNLILGEQDLRFLKANLLLNGETDHQEKGGCPPLDTIHYWC